MNITEPQAAADLAARHDPYAALRFRGFRLLLAGTFLTVVAEQMLGVAVGWELFERTRSPLALGLIGLVQVVPVVLLALPAGHVADRFDRKRIVAATTLLLALGLAALSFTSGALVLFYACLLGHWRGARVPEPLKAARRGTTARVSGR
jgi:MFS family permease